MNVIDRFLKYVMPEPNTGCWLWSGGLSGDSYGAFSLNSKLTRAHRVSYELFVGEIPDSIQVLHRCDVPCCVNPEHLFLGTSADNAKDKMNKGRQNFPVGERAYGSKLDEETVIAIRNTKGSLRAIGAAFGISASHVRRIQKRMRWNHLA